MRFLNVSFLLATAALSGCTATSASGPDAATIESNASVKFTTQDKKKTAGVDYALIDINSAVLNYVSDTTTTTLLGSFGGGKGGVPALPMGVGDVVQVAIFESQAGGLFIPSDAGSRPGNFISLPQQTVDREGNISVPYAGKIRATGRNVEDVQQEIEERLANRAIEPQALITKVSSRSAQAAVIGDVKEPMKVQLTEAGDRILDVISQAGGLSAPNIESYVTLIRRGKTARINYNHLISTPAENIYVVPGDTVTVERERRTYLAFGASGLNGRFEFEDADLKLSDALGKAGGLLDSRADPAQVYIYRIVSRELLVKLGVNTSKFPGEEVPVIFRANLRDPATFFASTKFPMQDRDIIYVTNSQATELYKFLDLVGSVPATASNVSGDALSTRNNIRAF
ncbi:polysaccharide biosynthesis/export family protein [Rhizobium sp. RM]|uniref:polysaccharide biosynthesis/export family protein n=1 Tax=Rhizobium/Agrobacterium group TaxID=227290 RepID=UPI00110D6EE4|nr:polysaccharide biosynthesis/export family protein [Rhizobium sp. RM]NWJ23680.1 polysaccharide export protein [Rhizobium sp. RM]TMV19508.1 polysaccharide export protein [Rhizobium sp. Td3]